MRILVTGASGKLGLYLLDALQDGRHTATAWSGQVTGSYAGVPFRPTDLAHPDQLVEAFREAQPEAVIHAAAESSIAGCLENPDHTHRINVSATELLADLCHESQSQLVFVSTDMVFDGQQGNYREVDATSPVSSYGRSKVAAEATVLARDQLVVRVSLMYGPARGRRQSFFDQVWRAVKEQQQIALFRDEWRTPLSLHTAARALVVAATSDAAGVLHVGGPERLSRFEMGERFAAHVGQPADCLVPIAADERPSPEPRPPDLSLDSSRWQAEFPTMHFPVWEDALAEMGIPAARAS